jgi:hypothetical protein
VDSGAERGAAGSIIFGRPRRKTVGYGPKQYCYIREPVMGVRLRIAALGDAL